MTHHIEIQTQRNTVLAGDRNYSRVIKTIASCSCGWVGREWDRAVDAVEDGDEHVRLSA